MLDKAMRELDRERMGLQNQEKKLIAEIKKMAKEGQLVSSWRWQREAAARPAPPPARRSRHHAQARMHAVRLSGIAWREPHQAAVRL